MGAQAGIGICQTEKGERPKQGYEALLEVVVKGFEYPEQMARALFYHRQGGPAVRQGDRCFAGGKGDFLRE